MRAAQLIAHGAPGRIELRQLPQPQAGPGEVIIDVRACGLNHLDLWLEEAGLPVAITLPRTPGGEVAGIVAELGAGVHDWQFGDRVAVQSNLFCGVCEFCRRGEESMCLRSKLLGVDCDGGFAEKVVVPATSLVRLPEAVSFEQSAALTLAASTAMHMLTDRTEVRAGDWVLVVGGASGVGSAAIQIAKGQGAHVIATASSDEKAALAQDLGARFVVDSTSAKWPSEVRRLTDKRGVDLTVEHVGGEMLVKCFDCLARGGTIVTCGATAGREVTLNLWPMFVKQQRLVGSYGRNRADMRATLEWAAAGKLRPVIHSVLPLERTAEAFFALRERKVLGKMIIVPA